MNWNVAKRRLLMDVGAALAGRAALLRDGDRPRRRPKARHHTNTDIAIETNRLAYVRKDRIAAIGGSRARVIQ
jgi:hypothetical protein